MNICELCGAIFESGNYPEKCPNSSSGYHQWERYPGYIFGKRKNFLMFLEDEEYEQLNMEIGDLCSELVKKARGHLGLMAVFNILRHHWKYDNALGEGYYFYVGESVCYICGGEDHEHPTEIAVAICSKEYFDTQGHLQDKYLDFDIAGLTQEQESIFMPESESVTIEEIREKLIDLGFEESEKFSSFCSTHNPFV